MTTKSKTNLKIVQPDLEQMEAVVTEAAAQQAPIVRRLSTHRDRFDLGLKELEGEEAELIARRDLLQRQCDAVISGLNMHIEDIRATKAMYEAGLNATPEPRD